MSEPSLDKYLLHVVKSAQQQPPGSQARRKVLAKLIHVLQTSNQLIRPRQGQFQGLYEDIYQDAVYRLFSHVCDRIDTYNPKQGRVLQWVNFLLSRRFFIEASRDILPTMPRGIDAKTIQRLSIHELDANISSDAHLPPSLSEDVRNYIEEDPNNIFLHTHIKGHPQANFQYIALNRLDGYPWKKLANELNLRVSTLSTFYQRCTEKFAHKFRRDLL